MRGVLQFLAENGAMLLTGVTALLLAGALLAAACRSPLHRQRACEFSILAALAWTVLACLPLPRVQWPTTPQRAEQPAPAIATERLTVSNIPPELIARPRPAPILVPAAQPIAPLPIRTEPIDWRPRIVAALLIGSAACCAWLALGHLLLWHVIRRAAPVPAYLTARLTRRRLRILASPRVAGPVTCGVWWPTILLPPALLQPGHETRLRQVLLHELAHIDQRDALGNALFCLALPLLYFHPLYWWLRRGAQLARELVADDQAARADGKAAYAGELVALAAMPVRGGLRVAVAASGIGILQRRSHFYRRMHMLLQRTNPLPTRCSNIWRAALTLLTLAAVAAPNLFVGVRPARAQDDSTTAKPETPPPAFDPANPPTDRPLTDAEKQHIQLYRQKLSEARQAADALARSKAESATVADRAQVDARIAQLEAQLREAQRALNLARRRGDARQAIAELTESQIGMIDPVMRSLVAEQAKLEDQLAQLKSTAGDGNPQVKQLTAALETTRDRVKKYAVDWRELQLKLADAPTLVPGGREKELAAEVASLQDQYAQLKRERDEQLAQFKRDRAATGLPAGNPAFRPNEGSGTTIAGVQLDLINLANSLVDAAGAVRGAKVRYENANRLVKGGAVTELELATARNDLETASQRLELLRSIAAVALQSAEADVARTKQMFEKGLVSTQEMEAGAAKLKMLQLILKGAN